MKEEHSPMAPQNHSPLEHVVTTRRRYSGFAIGGRVLEVSIGAASQAGFIAVSCGTTAESTDWGRGARIGEELPRMFMVEEIRLSDDRLECLHANPRAPFFRSGFVVELEPGMAAAIQDALGKVIVVAELVAELERATEAVDHPASVWSVFQSVLPDIAATYLLDAFAPEHAVKIEMDRFAGTMNRPESEEAAHKLFCEVVLRNLTHHAERRRPPHTAGERD